jgi:uncharacterized damage-inducible protein DinB
VANGRENLITGLRSAHAKILEAIDGLSDDQISTPGPEGWSIKDHLNHITVWDEFRFHEINRISRGGQAAYPPMSDADLDILNNLTVAMRRQLPVAQVIADLESARALVIEGLEGATERAMEPDAYGEVGVGGGIVHNLLHAEAIRQLRGG